MNPSSAPIIVQPGGGKELRALGDILTVLIEGAQTGGKVAVMLDVTPPDSGPPLHRHSLEDELFLVIDGRISYLTERRWTEVGPGGVVYLPRGTIHSYRKVGTTPSRQWIITTPSGFETLFSRCADEFALPGGPDMGRIVAISGVHGIEYVTPAQD